MMDFFPVENGGEVFLYLTYTRSRCNLYKNISNSMTRTSSQESLSAESRRLVQADDKVMMKNPLREAKPTCRL